MNISKSNKRIYIRCTEEDFYRIKIKALDANMTVTEYALKAMLEPKIVILRGLEPLVTELSYIMELNSNIINQIRKIGVNINQIARAVNTDNKITESKLDELIKKIQSVENRQNEYLANSTKMTSLISETLKTISNKKRGK